MQPKQCGPFELVIVCICAVTCWAIVNTGCTVQAPQPAMMPGAPLTSPAIVHTQPTAPAPVVPAPAPVEVIDPSGTTSIEVHGASNYSVVSKGKKMGVISWKVAITNTATVHAKYLVIECMDSKGKIIAKDHRSVNVLPNTLLEQTGSMDVPVDVIEAMKTVDAHLSLDEE